MLAEQWRSASCARVRILELLLSLGEWFGLIAMFLLTKPSARSVREYLSGQENASFSYPQVGATRQTAPRSYIVDHNRLKWGQGTDTFKHAVLAVKAWKMFDFPWLELHPRALRSR